MDNKPISIEELKGIKTQLIEITDFSGEGSITVEVRRPSILTLAASGKLPNELLSDVRDLFFGKKEEKDIDLPKLKEIYDAVIKAALVSPTFEELEAEDIQLTEMQIGEIYKYVTGGLRDLKYFRQIQSESKSAQYESILQKIAEFNSKNRG